MKKSYIVILLSLLTVNCFIYYYINCGARYVQSTDVWGETTLIDMELAGAVQEITKNLPDEPSAAYSVVNSKMNLLSEYLYASRVKNGDYTALSFWDGSYTERKEKEETAYSDFVSSKFKGEISALETDINAYMAVLAHLDYISGYKKYIEDIAKNADEMVDLQLYKENENRIIRSIVKTKKDFYGLGQITLASDAEVGLDILINYGISDIFAVFISIAAAFVTFELFAERRNSPQAAVHVSYLKGTILFLSVIASMYLICTILTELHIGIGDFGKSIQSFESFKNCTFIINTGTFLLLWIISKLAVCFIIYSAVVLIITSLPEKKSFFAKLIPVILFAIVQLFFYTAFSVNSGNNVSVLLREINIFSAFEIQRFFTRYLNIYIFDTAASRLPVFIVYMAVIMLVCTITAVKGIQSLNRRELALAEQVYFDEINSRYAEFRGIWHDMKNHLLVIGMLIEGGDKEAARNYISEVNEKLEESILPVKTGINSTVQDALLFKKSETARQKGIELIFNINASPSGFGITDYDLCGIFGNILDNAIEAAEKLPPDMNGTRSIKLTTDRQHDMLYIRCENPYNGELVKGKNGFVTLKADKKTHGIGLSRVNSIVKKYKGSMTISTDKDIFKLEILI